MTSFSNDGVVMQNFLTVPLQDVHIDLQTRLGPNNHVLCKDFGSPE